MAAKTARKEATMNFRDMRDGGWFWAQNELMDVFLPLIGPNGVMVYMAVCRMINLDDGRMSMRPLGEAAGVSKSTAQREMVNLIALGMVGEKRGATKSTATYTLYSLKQVAAEGRAELERRLSVPRRDRQNRKLKLSTAQVTKPSVPQGDSNEAAPKEAVSGTDLSHREANLSHTEHNLSQKTPPYLIKEKEEERKNTSTPQPPLAGGLEPRKLTGLDDGPPNSIIQHGRQPRAPRQTAAERARSASAMIGAPAPVTSMRDQSQPLSSADVRVGVKRALAAVRESIAELNARNESFGNILPDDYVAEWDQAMDRVEYERHETPEGRSSGLVVVLTSPVPRATAAMVKSYETRIEAQMRVHLASRVQLQVMSAEEVAA